MAKIEVVICYAGKDRDFARDLRAALNRAGVEAALDEDFVLVGEWRKTLEPVIEAALLVIFIVSPQTANSRDVEWELAQAGFDKSAVVLIGGATPEGIPGVGKYHLSVNDGTGDLQELTRKFAEWVQKQRTYHVVRLAALLGIPLLFLVLAFVTGHQLGNFSTFMGAALQPGTPLSFSMVEERITNGKLLGRQGGSAATCEGLDTHVYRLEMEPHRTKKFGDPPVLVDAFLGTCRLSGVRDEAFDFFDSCTATGA